MSGEEGKASYGPAEVRKLRGARSRAVFARELGVTPQTVYRWELPDGASEARRPRGQQLARLELLRTGAARAQGAEPASLPLSAADAVAHSAEPAALVALDDDVDADTLRVLPALERVLHGDLRRGHRELLEIVTQGPALSLDARGAAYFGIALWEACERSDARAALLLIGPLLQDAEAGRLKRDIAAKLFAVAALCHALPDALLFDVGRVQAYQARIERGFGAPDPEAACLALVATLVAATLMGDLDWMERSCTRLAEPRFAALPPLLALLVEEFSLFSGAVSGRLASTIASCEAIAARAEQHGYTLVLARCLGRLALCQLDALVDPEQVLKVTQRIRTLTSGLRCAVGMHQVLALRAEIEALFRLGRIREACAVADELETWRQNSGVPALATVSIETRLWTATHDLEKLDALAAGLRSCELPALRGICTAYADFVTGVRAYASDDDLSFAIACLERAEAQAARWPFLVRDVLLYRNYAHASAGHEALGRHALRAAQRHADTYPAPWFAAHLRRIEGGLVAARGLWNEGKQLLQSACATFDLAKDRTDAAYTRYLMYSIANVAAPPDAESIEGLRAARAEFAELGLPEPRGIRAGVARFSAQRQSEQLAHTDTGAHVSERLVVPFQRVAMRGAAPDLILSELLSVVAELVPGRAVRLEEIGPMGEVRCLSGAGLADMPALDDPEWAEFSDGTGRLLRVGVQGALASRERATLTLLTLVAAQALEVAMLRGAGERTPLAAEAPALELPGFIAASSQMRSLRAELRRIASSRATVIITGESGTGKEIVARALHDLSERADKPYVAFNCATVPRELFEGQLFGYRRGSFTGAAFDHPGVIRAANGGTLFLDEIGELPLDIQPKLLRFLENSEVFPLGERAPVRVDVRVVAATHRDLSALIRSGGFREDLYYRLQVVPVFIPPLRERRDDIAVLARHFLRELTRRGEPPVLAPDAVSALLAQSYQGNVRELKNIIERALAYFPDQPVLQAEHLRLSRARGVSPSPTR